MTIISWEKVEPTTETLIDIVIYRLNIFNFYFAYGFVRCAFRGFGLEVSNGGIWGFKYPYVFRVLFWDKSHYLNFGFAEAPPKE